MHIRPFTILGVQQIALGAQDKSKLRALWVDLLGLTITGHFVSEKENVDEDICTLGVAPWAVEIDLMQPVDAHKKPAVQHPALNHIGLWVDHLPKAVTWLTHKGVRFAAGGIRQGAAGYDVCFIHPQGNDVFPIGGAGALIELVQAPSSVIDAFLNVATQVNTIPSSIA